MDLPSYLARIGYQGSRTPSLATLREVHALHPAAIAFDSLDPWLGRPVALDIPALERKLVQEGRGGYCYEHNTLLWAALEALGFKVRGLSARVLYSTPPGGGRHPRNHMLMLVETPEGPYIADVGFHCLLTAPVRLMAGMIQTTRHERVRLSRTGEDYVFEAEIGNTWRQIYQFGLEEHIAADYAVVNYYMSTHPYSLFTGRLVAARSIEAGRLALLDAELSIHKTHGPTEKRIIPSADELRRVLTEDFSLTLPDDARLDAKLEGLFVA